MFNVQCEARDTRANTDGRHSGPTLSAVVIVGRQGDPTKDIECRREKNNFVLRHCIFFVALKRRL